MKNYFIQSIPSGNYLLRGAPSYEAAVQHFFSQVVGRASRQEVCDSIIVLTGYAELLAFVREYGSPNIEEF